MIFNGLTKSDLVVFNALRQMDLSQRVSLSEIADLTGYSITTVKCALDRLVEDEMIHRKRETTGQAYKYKILDHYAFSYS